MTDDIKRRGRPKGSEKDDNKALAAIADLIHAAPGLKATTAMRRNNRNISDADIRRLQSKWKERQSTLLADAQSRAEAHASRRAAQSTGGGIPTGFGAMSAAVMTTHAIFNSPEMRAMREIYNSPTMQLMRDLQGSPAMIAIREFHNSPVVQKMREQQKVMAELNLLQGR